MMFNCSKIFSTSSDTPYKIDKSLIFDAIKKEPRRICFSMPEQLNLFKRTTYGNVIAELKTGFISTISTVLEQETGQKLYEIKKDNNGTGKYKCYIRDEDTYIKVQNFYDKYNANVFINDSLFLSMALAMYQKKDGGDFVKTAIGELESKAKWNDCKQSISQLSIMVADFINSVPYYKDADCICGVPSSKKLPENIASLVASQADKLTDISGSISFLKEKNEVKNKKDIDDRWSILETADLQVRADVKGKKIILLDDMYQTGITMQFIAMKLLEAGASNVYGLSLVKAASNNL